MPRGLLYRNAAAVRIFLVRQASLPARAWPVGARRRGSRAVERVCCAGAGGPMGAPWDIQPDVNACPLACGSHVCYQRRRSCHGALGGVRGWPCASCAGLRAPPGRTWREPTSLGDARSARPPRAFAPPWRGTVPRACCNARVSCSWHSAAVQHSLGKREGIVPTEPCGSAPVVAAGRPRGEQHSPDRLCVPLKGDTTVTFKNCPWCTCGRRCARHVSAFFPRRLRSQERSDRLQAGAAPSPQWVMECVPCVAPGDCPRGSPWRSGPVPGRLGYPCDRSHRSSPRAGNQGSTDQRQDVGVRPHAGHRRSTCEPRDAPATRRAGRGRGHLLPGTLPTG